MHRDDDRRTLILFSAAELFAARGVANTTMRDIGESAGIRASSLYHHFPSKDSMVEAIVRYYLTDLVGRYNAALGVATGATNRLSALIRSSFESMHAAPAACEIYQNDYRYIRSIESLNDLEKMVAEIQKMWIDVIRKGMSTGEFRPDLDPTIAYRFLRDAIWPTVQWNRTGRRYRIEDITTNCIALFIPGFEARNAR